MRKVGVNVVVRKVSSSEEMISHTFLLEGNPIRLMSVEEITRGRFDIGVDDW